MDRTPRQKALAEWLLEYLRRKRSLNVITPSRPLSAHDIAARYNETHETPANQPEASWRDVQAAVGYLRREYGHPIGSVSGTEHPGYYFCKTRGEWEIVAAALRERIRSQMEAIEAPTLRMAKETEIDLFAGP